MVLSCHSLILCQLAFYSEKIHFFFFKMLRHGGNTSILLAWLCCWEKKPSIFLCDLPNAELTSCWLLHIYRDNMRINLVIQLPATLRLKVFIKMSNFYFEFSTKHLASGSLHAKCIHKVGVTWWMNYLKYTELVLIQNTSFLFVSSGLKSPKAASLAVRIVLADHPHGSLRDAETTQSTHFWGQLSAWWITALWISWQAAWYK